MSSKIKYSFVMHNKLVTLILWTVSYQLKIKNKSKKKKFVREEKMRKKKENEYVKRSEDEEQ